MKAILVYDDERHSGEQYANILNNVRSLKGRFCAETLPTQDFLGEMKKLTERQKGYRRPGKVKSNSSIFDEVSIFVIDYDLLRADTKSYWTGEVVAYLTRCYSQCGILIGLNQFGDNPFDLTLKGHLESYADLNIGSKQLGRPGLWGGAITGFRPWYWPDLINYLDAFHKKVKEVIDNIDEPLSEVVGISEIIELLPKTVIEFVGKDPRKVTFRDFVTKSGQGLRRKDKNPRIEDIARIAAARISKWLERLVLSGQNFLVDAPHLVSRYPSLLKGKHSSIESWDRTAKFQTVSKLGLDHSRIEKFRFRKEYWFSRPVWFWRPLSEFQKIREVSRPWEGEKIRLAFCEDSSSFHPLNECKEFLAEVDSPYDRRYVYHRFAGVDYQPRVRLLGA